MLFTAATVAILLAGLMYGIVIYNLLVSLKNNVSKNWANIDVLLKQRYSELPKLIESCKTYMQFESSTLEAIVNARSAALSAIQSHNLPALSLAEVDLKTGLSKLFALVENYPNLKTNQSFLMLQTRITDLETEIADRREFYNESANRNNIRIQQFPDVIIARLLGFKAFDLLKFSPTELEDVGIEKHFKNS